MELEVTGHDINFVSINAGSALDDQAKLTRKCSFPLLQDLDTVDAWGLMGGKKDDFFIYDTEGKLVHHYAVNGEPSMNLGSEEGYNNLKNAILEVAK